MSHERLGALIGGVFGLVFVLVNSDELPSDTGLVIQVLGVVAFIGMVGMLIFTRPSSDAQSGPPPPNAGFGRMYWLVVIGEAIALAAGLIVINGVLDSPDVGVAWVSFVVGVHFFGLAAIWREPFFRILGTALAACGLVGLTLAVIGTSEAWIAAISGVVPGLLLLAAGWLAVLGVTRSLVESRD